MELIPPPDFERSTVTRKVLREDRRTLAKLRKAKRMREDRDRWLRQKAQLVKGR